MTNKEKIELITIDFLNGVHSKKEIFEKLGICNNSLNVKVLNKKLDDLNFKIPSKKTHLKKCEVCGKEFKAKHKIQKYCSHSCSATATNKKRPKKSLETRLKISRSLHNTFALKGKKNKNIIKIMGKKIKLKNQICPKCGNIGTCNNKVCNFGKKFITNLKYFGLDEHTIGTENIFEEIEKVISLLEREYIINGLSPSDLKKKYGYPKTYENITQILKRLGIKTRNISESIKNGILHGNIQTPFKEGTNVLNFKNGYHTSWEGKTFKYRSSFELNFAIELDSKKIKYEMEGLKIKYYDTQQKKERIAIPDFLLLETNEIIEIKSRITFNKQNMIDKFKSYSENGYTPKLLFEGTLYDAQDINNIKEYDLKLPFIRK